ncbi:MAG TPA: hypothetical protein VK926_04860 [Gaiellaceae bacterium]|nr:hypothetical protein [Gaiellaceae bacterium]
MREAFTPDFYLPELDVYVECTVARQVLTNRKRQKARKKRERSGAVVEILFRRDFERLARRWNLPSLEHPRAARLRLEQGLFPCRSGRVRKTATKRACTRRISADLGLPRGLTRESPIVG